MKQSLFDKLAIEHKLSVALASIIINAIKNSIPRTHYKTECAIYDKLRNGGIKPHMMFNRIIVEYKNSDTIELTYMYGFTKKDFIALKKAILK